MSLWHAIKGGATYAAAVASGDVADADEQRLRIGRCRTCPSLSVHRVPVTGQMAGFCGQPFHDGGADSPATCGCLVAACAAPERGDGEEPDAVYRLRVLAALTPAGKACVGSQRCGQGRW